MRHAATAAAEALPCLARRCIEDLRDHLSVLDDRIAAYDKELEHLARGDEAVVRLMGIAGVGPLTASGTAASVHGTSAR